MIPANFVPAIVRTMSPEAIDRLIAAEQKLLELPQVEIHTQHVLHGRMYTRTITIPAGIILTGALVKIPTMLVIHGDVLVSRGDEEAIRIQHAVIPASAGRKQAFITEAETYVTMAFPTDAKTIEEAEAQFTDDTDLLFSRRDPATNAILITGE